MKKLIQICSILGLLIVFSAVAAKAQAVSSYKAEIPFNFSVGQKSYQAGSYVIKTAKLSESCVSLTLQDKQGNKLQTILVPARAEMSKKQPELVFNRYDNERYLTKLSTPDASISIVMSENERQTAKKIKDKKSSTQVALIGVK